MRKAVEHLIECVGIATELGSTAQSLWLADGTNYPGQDDLSARHERVVECLSELYAAMPPEQEMLVEYKFFEPAFYATDIPDWGTALSICQRLGERARVLVDFGHHAQGTNVEQIVALIAAQNRLGGFHFNDRKYADDDLMVGLGQPVRAVPRLLRAGARRRPRPAAAAADDRPVPQRRGEGRGDDPQRRHAAGGLCAGRC